MRHSSGLEGFELRQSLRVASSLARLEGIGDRLRPWGLSICIEFGILELWFWAFSFGTQYMGFRVLGFEAFWPRGTVLN